jgi:hypothetical protein
MRYDDLRRENEELREQRRILQEAIEQPCPVTGEKFFMAIHHPDLGWVPTYGGPYDSYTTPRRDRRDDATLFRWRYDHASDRWAGLESIGLRVVED